MVPPALACDAGSTVEELISQLAEVPGLVGLSVRRAQRVGHEHGFVVIGPNQDGPPLGALTWPGTWLVTAQDPAAGIRRARGEQVTVRFAEIPGGGTAGDREPRLPLPSPLSTEAAAEFEAGTPASDLTR